jgi:hypothetical protein
MRAEAKDYIDMDALLRLGKVDLPSALAAAEKLYGPTFNPEITLNRALKLCSERYFAKLLIQCVLTLVNAGVGHVYQQHPIWGGRVRASDKSP